MNKNLLRAPGLVMLLLTSAASYSQNLPPIANNDTVYMCASTITIYVQDNDINPDGDPLTLSIYAGSINGYFTINGGAINYTPNIGYSGLDSLVYVLCDDGVPPMCDTAIVYIYVNGEYSFNESATICDGDSIFLAGAWRTESGMYVDSLLSQYGCDSVITTTLNVITPPQATITYDGSLNLCTGDSVTLMASAGASWFWSTGETTQNITVSTAGTYWVQIANSSGCTSQSASVNVTTGPGPQATITPGGPIFLCAGDSVTLTANGSTASTWLWSNGATTQSITVHNAGNYSVTVNYGSCQSTSAPVTVIDAPVPSGTITASGSLTICEGDSVILYAVSGPFSYYWSTGDTSQFIIVDTSGTFSLSISDPYGCSTISSSVTVTLYNAPPANIIANGPLTFCEGDSVILTATNGVAWLWNTGATTQSITVYDSGNYSVIVSDGLCTSTSDAVSVTVDPSAPATVTQSGPLTFCEGGSVTLTANAGAGYFWNTGDTTQSITVDTSGTYYVNVNYGQCASTSPHIVVTENPNPSAAVSASGPLQFCQGDSVILTANGGTFWMWTTGENTQSIVVDQSGTYSVIVYNQFGCMTQSSAFTTTVFPAPPATITAGGPTTFCTGDDVTLTANTGQSYLWSNGATSQSITVSASGLYSVTVDYGGCSSTSAQTQIIALPVPDAGILAGGPTSFCEGGSVTLYASGGVSYEWSTGSTAQNITVTDPGLYWVIADNGACRDTSAVTSVIVYPAPAAVITANGPTTFCEGDSVLLTASNGASWQWSSGATSQSVYASEAGSLFVTVTDGNGCSAISPVVNITTIAAPEAIITAFGNTQFCIGDSVVLTAQGTPLLWSTGDTTNFIVVHNAGDYYVIASNACGTDTSSLISVIVDQGPPVAGITYVHSGLDYGFTSASTGSSGWYWNFGDNNNSTEEHPVHSYAGPGTYNVMLICFNGCGNDTAYQVVKIDETLLAHTDDDIFNGFSPNGDGHNDVWNVPLLDLHADNSVTIVNRWGVEVWKAENYNNNSIVWAGENLNGEKLPDGTYFYIITFEKEEKRGWVFIKR